VNRFFDIIASVILLVLTSWLFLLILTLYTLTLEFPILFIQHRIGRNEKAFKMLKFRTLKPGTLPARERRFLLGDILRFFSLDELPQLFNVLKGDMSLIGPRPLPIEYLNRIPQPYRRRHDIRPGITGWAQVNGRHSIPWEEKFKLDLYYVDNRSLSLDMKIILKTVVHLLSFRKDTSLKEEELQ
jgi:lipopolysaccharide/colanic/teichoic acid biosynthesis glycosyltransferase